MSLRNSRKTRREDANLELTPLIDVVFLLLIFFLITTTFSKSQEAEIPISLPEAVSGEQASASGKVVLFITEEGAVELRGDDTLVGETVAEKLADLHGRQPDADVVLKGDKGASHGKVIEVLDQLKQTGFKKVNLVISQPDAAIE
jgi:biopolymer transport protein ExbD